MAAEEVMMHISGADKLGLIRRTFLSKESDSLDLKEFVTAMLPLLPKSRSPVELAAELMELFEEIDVNGDGDLEWDEFTSFCIEAAIAATRRETATIPNIKYIPRPGYADHSTRTSRIERITALPAPYSGFVVVEEMGYAFVRIYTTDTVSLHLDLDLRTGYVGPAKTMQVSSLGVLYIPQRKWLVISSTDCAFTFWNVAQNFAFVKRVKTPEPQAALACGGADTLYSSSLGSSRIESWSLKRMTKVNGYNAHSDAVTCLLGIEAEDVMVSASLDRTIQIFELTDRFRCIGELRGHTRGIRQMVYLERWGLLMSCGFETSIYGWSLSQQKLLIELRGHSHPVLSVREFCFPKRAAELPNLLTLDERGIMKVFDLNPGRTGNGTVMMTIEIEQPLGYLQPSALAYLPESFSLLAGRGRLYHLVPVPTVDNQTVPYRSLYNPTLSSFLTVSGPSVRVFNYKGHVLETFANVCSSNITAICWDDRQRKLIAGTQDGDISIINFANGTIMKATEPQVSHTREVTNMTYVDQDKIFVTVSWDRSIRIYDEDPQTEIVLLRSVTDAHRADITCVAVNRSLCLLATGAADGSIHVRDFQTLELIHVLEGHAGSLTSVKFLEPFPVLLSTDNEGTVRLWGVRGGDVSHRGICVCTFRNIPGDKATHDQMGQVIADEHDSDEEGSMAAFEPVAGAGGPDPSAEAPNPDAAPASTGSEPPVNPTTTDTTQAKPSANPPSIITQLPASPLKSPLSRLKKPPTPAPLTPLNRRATSVTVKQAGPIGISACGSEYLPDSDALLVCTGDDQGYIGVWDVLPALHALGVEPLQPQKNLAERASYDAHTRMTVPGVKQLEDWEKAEAQKAATKGWFFLASAAEDDNESEKESSVYTQSWKYISLVSQWKAHRDGILSLDVITDPHSILTTSLDGYTRVWNFEGEEIGMLIANKQDALRGWLYYVKWQFRPDLEKRAIAARDAAEALLSELAVEGVPGVGPIDGIDPALGPISNGIRRSGAVANLVDMVARQSRITAADTRETKISAGEAVLGPADTRSTGRRSPASPTHLATARSKSPATQVEVESPLKIIQAEERASTPALPLNRLKSAVMHVKAALKAVGNAGGDPKDEETERSSVALEMADVEALESVRSSALSTATDFLVKEPDFSTISARYANFNALSHENTVAARMHKPVDTTPSQFLASRLGIHPSASDPSVLGGTASAASSPHSNGSVSRVSVEELLDHKATVHRARPFSKSTLPQLRSVQSASAIAFREPSGRAGSSPGSVSSLDRRALGAQGEGSYLHPGLSLYADPDLAEVIGFSPMTKASRPASVRSSRTRGGSRTVDSPPASARSSHPLAAIVSPVQDRRRRGLWQTAPALTRLGSGLLPAARPMSMHGSPRPSTSSGTPRPKKVREPSAAEKRSDEFLAKIEAVADDSTGFESTSKSALAGGPSLEELMATSKKALLKYSTMSPARKRDTSLFGTMVPREQPRGEKGKMKAKADAIAKGEGNKASSFGWYTQTEIRVLLQLYIGHERAHGTVYIRPFVTSEEFMDATHRFPSLTPNMFDSVDSGEALCRLSLRHFCSCVFPEITGNELVRLLKFARKPPPADVLPPRVFTSSEKTMFARVFKAYDTTGTGLVTLSQMYDAFPENVTEFVTIDSMRRAAEEAGVDPDQPMDMKSFAKVVLLDPSSL